MEPRDPNPADGAHPSRPIVLAIDLNEIPPPSQLEATTPSPSPSLDAFALVRRFHGDPPPFPGSLASHPGDPGVGCCFPCGYCMRPETRGGTVVCDGCERGFHLTCVNFQPAAVPATQDWVCGFCVRSGGRSKRWPLGAVRAGSKHGGVRLLDINALPPSDGDGEGSEELHNSRMPAPGEDSFSGISSSVETPCSDIGCAGIGFDPGNDPGMAISTVKSSLEETVHGLAIKSSENVVSSALDVEKPNGNNITPTEPTRMQLEMFLPALKDYILEKQGVLDEGWHVEFKQSTNGCAHAIYCSPDGKKFESMPDVAHYLGLVSNCTSMDIEDRSNGHVPVQRGSSMRRRRRKELARLSRANSFSENQDNARNACGTELSSGVEILDPLPCDIKSDDRFVEAGIQENSYSGSHHLNIDFPVQFGDFFLLHIGEIDLRPTYHSRSQIWPVGYRSCWHDRITGSLFNCEVSDGGIYGPAFKVRRSPCSFFPVPVASTIFSLPNIEIADAKGVDGGFKGKVETSVTGDVNYEEDCNIEMLLSEYSPSEQDLLSCLGSSLPEASLGQVHEMPTMDNLPSKSNCAESPDKLLHNDSGVSGEIGELFVEGRSCSSVWKMVSRTFVKACCEVFKRSGRLQFVCNHDLDSFYSAPTNTKAEDAVGSLSKFCSYYGPIDIPHVIQSHAELETWCETLEKWLDKDRFGFDIEFVQEITEHLPGIHACLQYELLNKRSCHSTSEMVGSQLLIAKRKREEEGSGALSRGHKKSRNQNSVQPHDLEEQLPPLGRPLSGKLPVELVGDVVQVWELLWRFYEILGLKEPLSFEELEQELIDPWFDGPNFLEKLEKEIQEGRDQSLQKTDNVGGQVLSSSLQSDSMVPEDDQPVFIQLETGSMKDAAQAKVASRTYGRCTGVALTKAHTSLLKVLVGELQSKVAAFVDPSYDAGELKSKRGRKKDVDNLVPVKTSKIDILPINELTWPELARRYILAFLAMDGNLDSAEIASRESGKVFRCLQGDGGVLCGSLTGVAGMEADALLLAEAEKQILGSMKRDDEAWSMDYKNSEPVGAYDTVAMNSNNVPEWAHLLEPVRKLPTNVGTRIRKCIYDALEKGPPEWARNILEHSISKEVYKGNASGPTKKAVLSVLAEVCGESVQQKPSKGRKEKSVSSVSDTIMKQCRSILRHAAAADDGKVFCNLLGTTLLNPNDNEDEGILGSSAMLSRPLDFRTIDLRLAAGAYGGAHEAFREDVREVWHNICIAYGDRSDLMQLAESLSKNFESLYDKEVLSLVHRRPGRADPECSNEVAKKEVDGVVACENEIPKAPWEEGVCKVCGIDRDDDSVLLCDTCDSEYHTYCLNPPLARIPEGNWYCPSCVAGQSKVQDSSNHIQVINRHRRKRYQRENTRMYLEALNQLAAMMEAKEYWDLTTEERIFLLKFLCDEVLNTSVIRDHLDQCADMSNDLQQKLRSLSLEWRNLKLKEDMLTARSAMGMTSKFNATGEIAKEGMLNLFANYGRLMVQPQAFGNRPNNYATFSADLQQRVWTNIEGGSEGNGPNEFNKHMDQLFLKNMPGKYLNSNRNKTQEHHELPNSKPLESEDQSKNGPVMDGAPMLGNIFSSLSVLDESNRQNKQLLSILPQPERGEFSREAVGLQTRVSGAENSVHSNLNGNHDPNLGMNGSMVPMVEVPPGSCLLLDPTSAHLVEHPLPVPFGSAAIVSRVDNRFLGCQYNVHQDVTESQQAYDLEMTSLKKEISVLRDSISSTESQLLKVSMRREFLGRDSSSRLYWIFGRPGKRPWLVVGGSQHAQLERRMDVDSCPITNSWGGSTSKHSVLFSRENYTESSKASSLSDLEMQNDISSSSHWVSYESEAEIQELLGWLRGTDSRERELKENLLQWQRVQLQQSEAYDHDDPQGSSSKSSSGDKEIVPHSLITSATAVLETRHGPCLEPENTDVPKKRGKKSKAIHEERMFRCECMEPVWPSRYHCLSCHQTFCTSMELDEHDDGGCNHSVPGVDDCKDNDSSREGKGMRSEVAREKELPNEADVRDAPKTKRERSGFSSRLVKSQKGVSCPYNFDNICSKFVMNDSNKDLVKEIGLLGSDGNVSFLPSRHSNFSYPTLTLIHTREDQADLFPVLAAAEELVPVPALHGTGDSMKTCTDGFANGRQSCNDSYQQCTENDRALESTKMEGYTSGCVNDKVMVPLNGKMLEVDPGQSCTIPEMSLRPLVGKVSQILRRLKINLLDMDAALPEEALKPSKAQSSRRRAWRAFVKSSESIYEIIQATIIFENTIKADYLKNGWWFWSSLTAAAKTTSVSSLALRIYSLDAAIIYEKAPLNTEPTDNQKARKSGKKKKKKDTDG